MIRFTVSRVGAVVLTAVFLTCIILVAGWGRVTAVPPTSSSGPPEGWEVECIECIHYFTGMSGSSAVLDSGGMVHTAYGGDGLYYAVQQPDDSFDIEVVDDKPYRGGNATMVFDSQERPHILYYAADLLGLNYARFDGSEWQIETVPTADLHDLLWPWLVIDSSDNLHLVYNENGTGVVYGRYDQISWAFEVVDTVGAVPIGRPSIALDSSDLPHLTYASGQKYAFFDGLDWQITTFTDSFNYGENAAIALDQNDQPHIAFQAEPVGGDSPDIYYRYIENSTWKWEVIELADGYDPGTDYLGQGINLIFDAANQPTVTYSGSFTGPSHPYPHYHHLDLHMAYRDANGWQVLPRFNLSYVLDDTNYASLINGPGGSLRIVTKDGPDMKLIELEEDDDPHYYYIDRGGSTGTHNDMVVDRQGRLQITHHEAELNHLRYAVKEDRTWTVQTLTYNVGFLSDDWKSIALTSADLPFIMYRVYDRFGFLFYTFFDGQDWIHEYHYGDNSNTRFDLTMNSEDNLQVAYFDKNRRDLFYIVRFGQYDWTLQEKLDEAMVDGKFEIALDPADFPHIAYPLEDGLGYAEQTPAGWITGTVAAGVAGDASLALDEAGNPHIAWYDTAVQDLKYAHHDGSSWHFATIDDAGDVGQYPDIEVDNLGRIYIAYYDVTNQDLKYAAFDDNSWTTMTLLSEGDVGSYASLVLPYAGYPAIAYYDGTTHDLKMVFRPFVPSDFSFFPVFRAR